MVEILKSQSQVIFGQLRSELLRISGCVGSRVKALVEKFSLVYSLHNVQY